MSRTKRDHLGCLGWRGWLNLDGRDKKRWCKPPRWFKVVRSRIRRAKDRTRLRQGRDAERWRRGDQWEWT